MLLNFNIPKLREYNRLGLSSGNNACRSVGTVMRPRRSPRIRSHAEHGSQNTVQETAHDVSQSQQDAAVLEAALEEYKYKKVDIDATEDPIHAIKRRIDAVGRELQTVTEEDYRRLSSAEASASGRTAAPTALPEEVLRDLGVQLRSVKQNILPHKIKTLPKQAIKPEGSGAEIMLQGFNWESWRHDWYNSLGQQIDDIADAGFTVVWLPPPTDSVSAQGYMPRDLYNLDSKYGSEVDLLELIRRLQSRGIKVLGDAVLNHRCASEQGEHGVWNKYGGRLGWNSRAIVGDDPNFRGKGNRSSGDHFLAAPNIDHSQDFVKRDLSEWMQWLRTHAGFDGWRLDFVKGFHGSHIKDYMEASVPSFAVGEYWDTMVYDWDGSPAHNQDAHRQRTVDWINAAGGLSTAFDITTKGILHAVFERCEYWRLRDNAKPGKPPGLIGWWPSRAVTFIENHDTGSSQGHWRFPGHALEQGYAYILTHPGTPCVMYDHMFHDSNLSHVVRRLVELRKRLGLHCRSSVTILHASHDVYAAEIDEKLVVKLGPGDFAPDLEKWKIADCGSAWAVWDLKDSSSTAAAAQAE